MTIKTRRSESDIIMAELQKLLQQELTSGLRGLFADIFKAQGQGAGLNVVINNNVGAQVSARETQGPFNQKQLEITIDQMVASALTQGQQTSGVLRSIFGLTPGLIGR